MKKLISLILVLLLAISVVPIYASDAVEANAANSEISVTAKSALLMEASTGAVLYAKNEHEPLPLASVTKIMTLLLVMEQIDCGSLKLTDVVVASTHASKMGGSQIWLKEGEEMTVHDLLKATAIASANDAAMALAEHIGGSEEGFVAMMNNKAAELQMKDTIFVNPTGLDAQGHVSSAYDIAVMSKALLERNSITDYTTIWMDSLRGGKTELVNTNKLVRFYKGATGLKTGTTNGAGSCVSASARRGDMSLISVVMGSPTSKDRFDDARSLLDYGFARYVMYHIVTTQDKLAPIKVEKGISPEVKLEAKLGDSMVLSAGMEKKVTEKITIAESLQAPVRKGEEVGRLSICIDEKELASIPIVTADEVPKINFWFAIRVMFNKLVSM